MVANLDSFPSVLGTLPPELTDLIRAEAVVTRSRRGSDVVSPGDTASQVFLLLDGRVQIRLLTQDGSEAILRDLEPGEFFGELAAIDDGARSAWVVALSDCVVARLPAATFKAAVIGIPALAEWMHLRLVAQIRDLTHRWFELNALHVRSRLHCELARMSGHGDAPVTLDPAPSHSELAARIGTAREAVSREMSYLSSQGMVEQVSQRRLTIHDPAGLRRLAEIATGGLEAGSAA